MFTTLVQRIFSKLIDTTFNKGLLWCLAKTDSQNIASTLQHFASYSYTINMLVKQSNLSVLVHYSGFWIYGFRLCMNI